MSEYLPKEVREGLEMARAQAKRRKSRLRVRVGGHEFTILRMWDKGFALDPADAPQLRGLVDVYDGARHLSQCLIVTSDEEAGERVFEFKRTTLAAERPPVDYEVDDAAPIGLLPRD